MPWPSAAGRADGSQALRSARCRAQGRGADQRVVGGVHDDPHRANGRPRAVAPGGTTPCPPASALSGQPGQRSARRRRARWSPIGPVTTAGTRRAAPVRMRAGARLGLGFGLQDPVAAPARRRPCRPTGTPITARPAHLVGDHHVPGPQAPVGGAAEPRDGQHVEGPRAPRELLGRAGRPMPTRSPAGRQSSRLGPRCPARRRRAGRSSRPAGPHVAAERADREDQPVEVVVDVEVAGEAGAGELRLVPGAVGALGVDQPADAALDRRAALARRPRAAPAAPTRSARRSSRRARSSPGRGRSAGPRPSRRRRSGAPPARRRRGGSPASPRVDAGRDQRRDRRRRCRRRGSRPSGRTRSRPPPARRSSQSTPRRDGRRAAAALGREHLDDVRGDVGGRRVDDRAEVAERQLARPASRVLSASKAPQPPSRLAMPHPVAPRSTAAAAPSGSARPGAARGPPRRCRRCRGSRRCRTRTPSRRAAAAAGAPPSRRGP